VTVKCSRLHGLADVHRAEVEGHGAGVDAGEVEDIVDDGKERGFTATDDREAGASAAANPMPLVAPGIRICLSFTAQQSKALAHARMICSIVNDLAPDQVRANGPSQQGLERYALTKSPPRRDLARRIGPVRDFGQRSIPRSIRVRTPSKEVTSRLSFLPRVNVESYWPEVPPAVRAAPSFVATGPSLGGPSVRNRAPCGVRLRRGNGINRSMLSRARHESRPRPCAIKNLRNGNQETRERRTFRPRRKSACRAHGCCRKSYVKHPPGTSLLAG
jgi:hypothetical protein